MLKTVGFFSPVIYLHYVPQFALGLINRKNIFGLGFDLN